MGHPALVIELSEQTIMDQLTERLSARFPQVPPETVASVVQDQHAKFDGRPVRDYIPLFVERNARTELSRLAADHVSGNLALSASII